MPFYADHISEHLGETPEGFLVCLGARLCRSGFQAYRGGELGLQTDDVIEVYRPPDEVLNKTFIASLTGKPVCDGHPSTFVDASNASWYAKGHVQNPRAGGQLESGEAVVVGDLVITDPSLADKIRTGLVRECSVGYEFKLTATEYGYEQQKLRANHVAVVPTGRAGPEVKIVDAVYRENFAEIVRRFLGRSNPALVAAENQRRTFDQQRTEGPMTKTKLRQLRSLLDELLEEEKTSFARDMSIAPDEAEDFARRARHYLGKELPRLGSSDADEEITRTTRRGRDSGDPAADFERDCRALRLRLQRGEK